MKRNSIGVIPLCLLACVAFGFSACGAAVEEEDTDQAIDSFYGGPFFYHRRPCKRAFRQCVATECSREVAALRQAHPFSPGWLRRFDAAKTCAIRECSDVCRSPDAGAGGSGGSGGSGSVCERMPNACQTCVCKPCEAQVATCSSDPACLNVMNCGFAKNCAGVDCYFNADGSRGPCADEIDAAGGPARPSASNAFAVFRCTEDARPSCSACTQ
jgi:hypothetical protein